MVLQQVNAIPHYCAHFKHFFCCCCCWLLIKKKRCNDVQICVAVCDICRENYEKLYMFYHSTSCCCCCTTGTCTLCL